MKLWRWRKFKKRLRRFNRHSKQSDIPSDSAKEDKK